VVVLVPLLGAACDGGRGGVDALLGDDPLLAVALGNALSDAVEVLLEVGLHAGAGGPVVAVVSATAVDATKGWGHAGWLGAVVISASVAKFLAGWHLVSGRLGSRLLDLDRHVLGSQSLAALIDHAVALDENVGFDVSSVGDLAGASGGIDLADAVVGNAHAGVGAVVVESALGGAVRSGHGVVVSAAHLQVGLELIDGLAGVNHSGEFGLDGHALIISDVHLLHGVAAHAQTTEIRYKGRGTKISRDIFCNYRIFMRFIK